MVRAHVIKLLPPFDAEEVSKHKHDVQFQLLYCLKGWMKGEYDGQEVVMREARAGFSRRISSTPCSAIPMIASCWKSSCPPISIPRNSDAVWTSS